jgi:hypothetical protein
LYDNSEASNIADLVMEKITGWKRIDRVINKEVKLSSPRNSNLTIYGTAFISQARAVCSE